MKKCGTVAIIGQPNVGKSSLLNHFVGSKLSITSNKSQTTRYQLIGIHTSENAQFIFVDTPGYQQKYQNQMNKNMNKTVVQALKDVDVILFLTESNRSNDIEKKLIEMIPKDSHAILAINKIDLIKDKSKLLKMIEDYDSYKRFQHIVPISVKKKLSLIELQNLIRDFLPEQDFIYEDDELTDKNERFLAAEIIREKVFRLTGQELPYSVAVEIEKFEETPEGLRRIYAAIIVDRESHKPMIIGKKGDRLKDISSKSRKDMEALFGAKVWLEVWVKVQKGWADDQRALKSLGL
ncbi:MAG: GTPase Era [Methylophilaceae bacterium]